MTADGTGIAQYGDARSIRLVMAALTAGILLAALDTMVFSTALPTIVGELHGATHLAWVTTAYLLTSTIVMPVYGKLGDLIGRKWLFVAALSLFLCGSVLGGLSTSMTALIVARAVQGLGGGGLMVLVQAIIADVVPPRERGRAMAVTGSMFAIASVIGPLLGGWFTNGIGWRWLFWINVPVAAFAILAAVALLHPVPRPARPRIDVGGIVFMSAAVTALVLLTSTPPDQWLAPVNLALIGVLALATVSILVVERRSAQPILPPRLLTHRDFVLATIGGLCFALAMSGVVGYLPTYLQMAEQLSATEAGLMMIPMVAGIMTSSFGGGSLISRTGRYRWMPIAGAAVVAVCLFALTSVTLSSPLWEIGIILYGMGVGMGLGGQSLVLTAQNAFPSEVGTATAAFAFFKEIGASLGASVIGGLFGARLAESLVQSQLAGLDPRTLTPRDLVGAAAAVKNQVAVAYHDALIPVYLGLVPMMLAAGVLLFFVRQQRLPTHTPVEAPELATDLGAVPTPDGPAR
ncbi:MAG: MDR family MFS transporter [Pseudolysinimonas sp.]